MAWSLGPGYSHHAPSKSSTCRSRLLRPVVFCTAVFTMARRVSRGCDRNADFVSFRLRLRRDGHAIPVQGRPGDVLPPDRSRRPCRAQAPGLTGTPLRCVLPQGYGRSLTDALTARPCPLRSPSRFSRREVAAPTQLGPPTNGHGLRTTDYGLPFPPGAWSLPTDCTGLRSREAAAARRAGVAQLARAAAL